MMKDIDIDRVMNHDKDKLKLKNLVRQAFRYIPGPLSDKEKLAIHNVVMEHIKSNKHHCEYWSDGDYASEGNDCTKMEPTYLYEMCADWAATSEENGSGLMEWYEKVVNKKFLFTTEQLAISIIFSWGRGKTIAVARNVNSRYFCQRLSHFGKTTI